MWRHKTNFPKFFTKVAKIDFRKSHEIWVKNIKKYGNGFQFHTSRASKAPSTGRVKVYRSFVVHVIVIVCTYLF